jgi:O-antigen/teichoic acid export membrane protein
MSSATELVAPPVTVAPPAQDAKRERKKPLARTIGGLTVVNGAMLLAAIVTGPLQGHALGPVGRGELAAVLAPAALAAIVAEFGLGVFAMREAARGRPTGVLVGTTGVPLLLIGLVVVVCSPFLATALVGHREPVRTLLTLGFCLLPISLISNLLTGISAGLEHWRAYSISRMIPPLGAACAMAVLYLLGALTVTSAVIVSFGLGTLALLPLLSSLRGGGRLRFDRALLRDAVRFSSKAWLGSLVGTANLQLDQVIMVGLVAPRQLGLYAVAVNVAGFSNMLTSSVAGAIFPRVAGGDGEIAARATRLTILIVLLVSIPVGVVSPLLLPLAFGSGFHAATVMVEILLAAGVAGAASNVLSSALTGAGRPGLAAIAEAVTLAVTLPGLILILPVLGGEGAALVTLAASAVSLMLQLSWSMREFSLPMRDFVLVRPSDVMWTWARLISLVRQGLSASPLTRWAAGGA